LISMDGGTKPNSLETQDRRCKGEWLAEQVWQGTVHVHTVERQLMQAPWDLQD